MPKKGLAYNPPLATCPHPPDLARFPEIQRLITTNHRKRMEYMRLLKTAGTTKKAPKEGAK